MLLMISVTEFCGDLSFTSAVRSERSKGRGQAYPTPPMPFNAKRLSFLDKEFIFSMTSSQPTKSAFLLYGKYGMVREPSSQSTFTLAGARKVYKPHYLH